MAGGEGRSISCPWTICFSPSCLIFCQPSSFFHAWPRFRVSASPARLASRLLLAFPNPLSEDNEKRQKICWKIDTHHQPQRFPAKMHSRKGIIKSKPLLCTSCNWNIYGAFWSSNFIKTWKANQTPNFDEKGHTWIVLIWSASETLNFDNRSINMAARLI